VKTYAKGLPSTPLPISPCPRAHPWRLVGKAAPCASRAHRDQRESYHFDSCFTLARTRGSFRKPSSYRVVSPVWQGYVGFGTGAEREKQSLFNATPARRVLEKVPPTSFAHARRPFGKPRLLEFELRAWRDQKADGNIRQRRSIAQTANTLNTAVVEAVKSSDGRGASVQPVSHELVGKINHKEEETE
jgi:hypothetical protein